MTMLEESSAFSEKFAWKQGIQSNFVSNWFRSVLMMDGKKVFQKKLWLVLIIDK